MGRPRPVFLKKWLTIYGLTFSILYTEVMECSLRDIVQLPKDVYAIVTVLPIDDPRMYIVTSRSTRLRSGG